MGRTNIFVNDARISEIRKLTGLKTKREIIDKALEIFVQIEKRKGILHYCGSGLWQGDPKKLRKNRAARTAHRIASLPRP